MPKNGFVIAIDGPVASGKGTIASKLAEELNGFYLYTGAMYRAVALFCIKRGISLSDEEKVVSVLPEVHIHFENGRIILNNEDITERIQEPDAASGASLVGVYPKVREELVRKQQQLADAAVEEGKIVVSEGRDTGTVVFPNAAFKLFLTARSEIRAKRRMEQYGTHESFERILAELHERDIRDTGRAVGPLPKNPEEHGYFILDNSEMSEKENIDAILAELRERKLIL
jgi:CMP/dCMP kinase